MATSNQLRFSKWLVKDEPSRLPGQSSHFIGVGGVIVDQGKLLLVQEKNGTRRGAWSIPGGMVDMGESLAQAVAREVKEETNLECEMEDIIYMREALQMKFNRPDLYFAVRMHCKHVEALKICEHELMDYRWVPIGGIEQVRFEDE